MALEAQGESIIELARLVIKCKPHHIFRKKQEVRIFHCENQGRVAEKRKISKFNNKKMTKDATVNGQLPSLYAYRLTLHIASHLTSHLTQIKFSAEAREAAEAAAAAAEEAQAAGQQQS